MTLSIIIVNYNVKYFLEQCLHSIAKSTLQNIEIIVVDNNSSDGSVAYLQPRFPGIRFIQNTNNTGFGRACNQGLAVATGTYILFLNPDTIIAEDTAGTCVSFFEKTTDAGAVGVRMVDGGGRFLKESKRSFPGPLTSLFKLTGLAKLFPKSKVFSRYHLGHLAENTNHEVDVLAGAFMMIRKTVLDRTGPFDETFFMYGEDVDLSYRIQKNGAKNYYLANTTIIHFKGESTKRGSLNYVRMFYSAMSIFVNKHYGGARAKIFNAFIHIAIWLRAMFSAAIGIIKWVGLPVADAALILLSFWLVKEAWAKYIRTDIIYSNQLILLALPAFALIFLSVAYYAGLYNNAYRRANLYRSTATATLGLLAAYALLPEAYRFSRGILFFGALLSTLLIGLLRAAMLRTGMIQQPPARSAHPYILIAGTDAEVEEVKSILGDDGKQQKIIDRVVIDKNEMDALVRLANVCEAVKALNAQEIILCTGTLSYKEVLEAVQHLKGCVRVRFHAAGSGSIIGSDFSSTSGETLSTDVSFKLGKPHYRRIKRLIDVAISGLFLLLFPLHFLFVKSPVRFLHHCLQVLFADKTWVGYITPREELPILRNGVLAPNGFFVNKAQSLPAETVHLLDYWYAKNYQPVHDLKIIYKNYVRLGE